MFIINNSLIYGKAINNITPCSLEPLLPKYFRIHSSIIALLTAAMLALLPSRQSTMCPQTTQHTNYTFFFSDSELRFKKLLHRATKHFYKLDTLLDT